MYPKDNYNILLSSILKHLNQLRKLCYLINYKTTPSLLALFRHQQYTIMNVRKETTVVTLSRDGNLQLNDNTTILC